MVASRLVEAHLEAQRRLRALAARGVERVWTALPTYDDAQIEPWLATVLPLMDAAQRQSILLTDAYVARSLERAPIGVDAVRVLAALRGNVAPEQEWRRPFISVWTALSEDRPVDQAIAVGLARATGTAAMDVQMAHRGALQAVQDRDPRIRGYRRVANAGACQFCSMIDGAVVKSADAMALHNNCGCGLEPIERDLPASPLPDGVSIRQHNELGPVLTDPNHHFETL